MTLFADRPQLEAHQSARLDVLLRQTWRSNPFYRAKWQAVGLSSDVRELSRYPLTTKDELVDDQAANPPYGTCLSEPIERYVRLHQTSGTKGKPLRWLDTPESWAAMLDCWRQIYELAELPAGERIFFPFSFGPFLGFWTAFDAATQLGYLAIPGGGLSTLARLRMTIDHQAGALCCTPTYALHLAQAATEAGID